METLQNIFQAQIIQKLGWTLVHFVWQGTAIGLILAVALRLLHKSSANLRYLIACTTLALMVLMPAITFRMANVPADIIVPVKQASTGLPEVGTDTQTLVEIPQLESPPAQVAATLSLKDRFANTVESSLPFIVAAWLAGVFGLSLWHLGGWRQLQRLRRQMTMQVAPALKVKLQRLSNMLGIRKTIGLVESALVSVPAVVGHLKPVILLPASALTGLGPQQIEAILAHELAHIKRHDYLANMLQTAVEILGFYHPAVWWVSHKIRVERENCCDDIAVSVCSDSLCYARALTTMEEIRAGRVGLAVAASGGNLFDRIRRLLGKDSTNQGKPGWLPSLIAILLIVALLIPTALALSGGKNEQVDRAVLKERNLVLHIQRMRVPDGSSKRVSYALNKIWSLMEHIELTAEKEGFSSLPGYFDQINEFCDDLQGKNGPAPANEEWGQISANTINAILTQLADIENTAEGCRSLTQTNQTDLLNRHWQTLKQQYSRLCQLISQDKPETQPTDTSSAPQILTTSYILSVPSDLPQLKEIISEDKSKTIIFTPQELEEFLNTIKTIPTARMISAPRILTNDGETGAMRTGDAEGFESIRLNIKNTVGADKKTVRLKLDFEYSPSAGQDVTSTQSASATATVLSGDAIAVACSIPVGGQTVLLLVKPQVQEKSLSKTGVVAADAGEISRIPDINFDPIKKPETPPTAISPAAKRLQQLVEDFFKNNYRDITARKTLEWDQPTIDTDGNMSIRYKYEATIRGRDKIIFDELFTFDKKGKFVSAKKLSRNKSAAVPDVSDNISQAGGGRFGAVIETLLPSAEGRQAKLLDIDTGKWDTKSDFGDDDRQTHQWIREKGLDLLGINNGKEQGLLSFDVAVLPVKSVDWEQLTAREAIANRLLAQMEANKITPMMPAEAPDKPATYLFRTRENAIGILQITDFTDNPKGVKIRYRILDGTAAAAKPDPAKKLKPE